MKSLIAIVSSILLCSCADMYVTSSQVSTPGGHAAAIDSKDYGSKGVHMITDCGVGAHNPKAIYIRPFCVDTAVFQGDEALSDGEMPIRKALAPVEFATDLKEQLEKIAPARILKDSETPRTGWLVTGHFTLIDGGDPYARFFAGCFGAGQSHLVLHVRVTDVDRGAVVYEFDMAGGSRLQGRHGTVRASGLGRATHFDMVNAAERIYITLSANPYRYGERGNISLPE
ncbi:MAG TPA: DUF4410 domain-containing protein [Chthoniobacterales bacterium]|jgi:hypothetical protein|nr:DUF4410 domain-containing protein [Chthoniobacterales bacterium]